MQTAIERPYPGSAGAAASLLTLAFAAACFTPRYPSPGEPVRLGADEALVVGSLRVRADGLEIGPGHRTPEEIMLLPPGPDVKLSLFHVERARRAPYVRVADDGDFAWVLPYGTYLVYVTPPGPPAYNVVVAAFQVPRGTRCVSIGRLVLETAADLDWAETSSNYDVLDASVEPDPDAWSRARTYPDLDEEPVLRSMIVDPALFGLFDDYSRSRCERILAQHGMSLGEPETSAAEGDGHPEGGAARSRADGMKQR